MNTVNLTKTTVNLSKGQKINLSKTAENDKLNSVMVALGWDPVKSTREIEVQPGFLGKLLGKKPTTKTVHNEHQADIDCDAWVALFDKSGHKIETVYYGNRHYDNDNIYHHGDNLTGEGDGDDEQITINLTKIPEKVYEILVGVTIYAAKSRNQNFGMIDNLFARIVDNKDDFEICRYETKEFSSSGNDTNFLAGRFIREDSGWNFEAIGKSDRSDSISDAVLKYSRGR